MDKFEQVAERVITYKLRTRWMEVAKMFSDMAEEQDGTLSMAFVLLAINEEFGTPVTKIAPRLGMEPNSLSRILKSMEEKGSITKRKDKEDNRKVYICLTDYGKQMRDIAFARFSAFELLLQSKLGAEKIALFLEVMDTISGTVAELQRK